MSELTEISRIALQSAAFLVDHASRALSPEQREALDVAIRGGARPVVELTVSPTAPAIVIYLVEQEGRRRRLAEIPTARTSFRH
ncbi:MAG TPA: hypothetical protein VJ673_23545 [Aromatoleum sp.]|uniref:hypothetical protein n=1 Tax=Aromatoleum sp. TaxID=2307007 RepID=UPI002B49975E|nr:hypothetical protein [Aromatoleum sp.]HJV28674.1 hypothetical protein [Aromatoleum sp.]